MQCGAREGAGQGLVRLANRALRSVGEHGEGIHDSLEGLRCEQTPVVAVIRGPVDLPLPLAGYCSGEDGAIRARTEARHLEAAESH